MKLNRSAKILVGGGTIWVLIYPLIFIVLWFASLMGFMSSASAELPFSMFSVFNLIFPIHCLTALIQFFLMGFYLFHIIKNIRISDTVRVIFGIGTFFMSFIAMPIYYYFFIWQDVPPKWALPEGNKHEPNMDNNTISSHRTKTTISKKKIAIVGGVLGILVLIIIAIIFAFSRLMYQYNQTIQDQFFSIPTPVPYENLPVYQENEKAFYQPVDISSFIPINTFKNIRTWSNYNQVPILVNNDNVYLAGYLHEIDNTWGSGVNVDVISADITTGKVNWQAVAGSAFLLKDSQKIYAEAPNIGAAGIVAYNINSGVLEWETRFDYNYAIGIGHLELTETDIKAETYNQGNEASYTVDKQTGKIIEVVKDTQRQAVDEVIIYDGIKFEKQGYGVPDKVTAVDIEDGSLIWEYTEEPVITNIAIGGKSTYFLTENNRLIAINTYTGEILGKLAFAPRFSHDFDFVNTSILVAADDDVVVIYFEDSKQLSAFSFANAIK